MLYCANKINNFYFVKEQQSPKLVKRKSYWSKTCPTYYSQCHEREFPYCLANSVLLDYDTWPHETALFTGRVRLPLSRAQRRCGMKQKDSPLMYSGPLASD